MKPAEAIGMILYSNHFGRCRLIRHEGGKKFLCVSLEKFPGLRFTAAWGAQLKRNPS